jgi:hypothetical protein
VGDDMKSIWPLLLGVVAPLASVYWLLFAH